MKPLKFTLRAATLGTLSLACLTAAPTFAEDSKAGQTRTYNAPNGNTIEVRRARRENEAGDVIRHRAYQVTDEDGELIRRGHDRVRVNVDGSKSGAQHREFVDADGNVHQKRRRAQADGEGNVRVQRHARVKDDDGNVTKRARSAGKRAEDGSRVKRQQRQFTDARGRQTDIRRKVQVDSQGNRRVKQRITRR